MGRIVSLDLPILDDLASQGGEADLVVAASDAALPSGLHIRDETSADGQRFTVSEGPEGLVYTASHIGSFGISPDGRQVRYRLNPDASAADVEAMILGPVIGLALQMQGHILLHAGALALARHAFAVSGPHGAGKSTLVTSFATANGLGVLTDDILPLASRAGCLYARRSHPRMKLWEDSAEAVGLRPEELPAVASGVSKRRVVAGKDAGTTGPAEVPLAAIYLLHPHQDSASPIRFRSLHGPEAALALVTSMYSPITLTGARAVNALDAATRIAESVPVRRISYFRSFENLPAIREAILRDVEEITSG